MKIKVCGLTKLNQIEELNSLEIDFLGFIFYEKSPRYVLNFLNFEEIKSIKSTSKVGVFVNETVEKIIEISENAGLNFIQLHGNENANFIIELKEKLIPKIEIIKVIRIGNQTKEELQKTMNQIPKTINYFLFDTDSKAFGGTGKTFSWQFLNEIKIPKPYFLSGGISSENIENIKNLNKKPFALDINSKFEIAPGNKDLEKIKKFVSSSKSPKGTT